MAKKIFGIYLVKLDAPNSETHARLELPASPWELHDAMDKVQLQENEELYLEIDDYYGFEYLAPHLMELDASLNELNDLAGQLAVLDETEQEAFDGLLRLEIQRKVETNGGILTMQDMKNLAVSAGTDCCHVVGATSDAELGRFYAENGFMEELDGISDDVFEMLDFGKIGNLLRTGENGTFTRNGYVVQHSELVTAPPCAKELPEKPEYLFRLTLGLHPDLEDDRTVTLELPASAEALRNAQKQIGADGWEGVVVLDYDGIIPQAAEFADLPAELDAFNDFAESVKDMPSREKQLPKLKALLEHFKVTDLAAAAGLAEHIGDYILTPEISSPQEAAIDELNFTMDAHSAELLLPHVNLFAYGNEMEQGTFNTYYAPVGFTLIDGNLQINQAEAPTIQRIFTEYLSGNNSREIAAALNKDKALGRYWRREAIDYILQNERYAGNALLQKRYGTAGKYRSRSRRPCGCSRCIRRNTRYTIAPRHGRRQKR